MGRMNPLSKNNKSKNSYSVHMVALKTRGTIIGCVPVLNTQCFATPPASYAGVMAPPSNIPTVIAATFGSFDGTVTSLYGGLGGRSQSQFMRPMTYDQ